MNIPPKYKLLVLYMVNSNAYWLKEFMKTIFEAEELYLTKCCEGVILHEELNISNRIILNNCQ